MQDQQQDQDEVKVPREVRRKQIRGSRRVAKTELRQVFRALDADLEVFDIRPLTPSAYLVRK